MAKTNEGSKDYHGDKTNPQWIYGLELARVAWSSMVTNFTL